MEEGTLEYVSYRLHTFRIRSVLCIFPNIRVAVGTTFQLIILCCVALFMVLLR